MTAPIPKNFSVYDLLDLQNEQNIFMERREMLTHFSERIEQEVIQQHLRADIFAGFQHLKNLEPPLHRYMKMTEVASTIWVFGEIDDLVVLPDGIHCVELKKDDKLLREWFVVVSSRDYQRALITREITPLGLPDDERQFEGILTSNREQVERVHQALKQLVGLR